MTEYGLLSAIKAFLISLVWTGSSNRVFPTGCVAVTGNVDVATIWALTSMRTPAALVQPLSTINDPEWDEDPNFIQFNVVVRLIVMVPGDVIGENAMMSANLTGGALRSEGRGIFEVEQAIFAAIGEINGAEGISLQCRMKSAPNALPLEGGNYVATRDYQFECMGTFA